MGKKVYNLEYSKNFGVSLNVIEEHDDGLKEMTILGQITITRIIALIALTYWVLSGTKSIGASLVYSLFYLLEFVPIFLASIPPMWGMACVIAVTIYKVLLKGV